MDEFSLISRYFAPLTADAVNPLGLRDDAALLHVTHGKKLVVTTDAVVEGVDFIDATRPDFLAHKALGVNLSDLAAMGATPHAYMLTLLLPKTIDETWVATFAATLGMLQQQFGIALIGGDMSATAGPLTISITAFGLVENAPLLRSGARAGDAVFATGTIGDAYLGLKLLQQKWHTDDAALREKLIRRYHCPEPRCAVATKLHGIATSCTDISDGLLQDAQHIANASGMGMRISAGSVPVSCDDDIAALATGGDDYELLFTAPASAESTLQAIAKKTGVAISKVGDVVAGDGVKLLNVSGADITPQKLGFVHF